jgi:hypothetical protein
MNVTEINQRIDQIERLSPAERMKQAEENMNQLVNEAESLYSRLDETTDALDEMNE